MLNTETRKSVLELAHNSNETAEAVIHRAGLYLDFVDGVIGAEPDEQPAEPKATRKPRKTKDADPTLENSATLLSAEGAEPASPEEQPTEDAPPAEPEPSGDDLVDAPPPDVSEVNKAVLAACKPDGIGKARVVELLGEFGSTGGVPGLPAENYRAFLDALESAK